MPVSVPVTPDSKPSTDLGENSQTCKGLYKRSRLDPLNCLIIPIPPPPRPSSPQWTHDQETKGWQRCLATGGYPSQLRSPTYLSDQSQSSIFHPPPYTPPPMLSPLRPGNGLYLNTLSQNQPYPPLSSTYNATCDGKDRISVTIDNTTVNIKPRINVGSRFQAEIPALRDLMYTLYEEHPAQLVWYPWKDLSTNTETQKRVAELLDMCCSSALPWGGTNIELALHCLHEVQGNIMAALDLLLMRGDYRTFLHPLSDYHYTGSDHWTLHEIRLFTKALTDHDKDFQQIHNVLQTKSVAQCVEYYYNMKKQKKFKQRSRAAEKKMEVERTLCSRTPEETSLNILKGTQDRVTSEVGVCSRL
ncbi:zinc finger protein 541 [Myxocyprinus asiaticus]|uniref:zinc finger protein 541 n=1 Tax=Myxocyprinus asiaticus TaxID=70543 RepID=UPI00222156BB|nr:zinc finger protein 541 [Myxocyprinus asiaticus]